MMIKGIETEIETEIVIAASTTATKDIELALAVPMM